MDVQFFGNFTIHRDFYFTDNLRAEVATAGETEVSREEEALTVPPGATSGHCYSPAASAASALAQTTLGALRVEKQ